MRSMKYMPAMDIFLRARIEKTIISSLAGIMNPFRQASLQPVCLIRQSMQMSMRCRQRGTAGNKTKYDEDTADMEPYRENLREK